MKKFHIAGLVALSFLGAQISSHAQQPTSYSSVPVGYVSHTLPPSTFNIIGITLHEAPNASGVFEVVTTHSVTDNDRDFTATLAPNTDYILEVTSGAANGELQFFTTTDVAGFTITTSDDLVALGLVSGDSYKIRKASTLASIFGKDNTAGLVGNGSSSAADQVWVLGDSGFTKYYYSVNPFSPSASSWKEVDSSNSVDASNIPIFYTDAIYISTASGGSDRNLIVTGSVKTTPTTYALDSGFNYMGASFPTGTTLESSGLQSQIAGNGSAALADVILIPNGTGDFKRYYYSVNPFNPSASSWKDLDTTLDVDATSILIPSAILIQRKNGAVNVDITPSY